MAVEKVVCTACSCLCDDLEVEIDEEKITRIENACLKGFSFLMGSQDKKRRALYLVEGREEGAEKAINKAVQLLSRARHPLIFGLDNSTLEAQGVGIELAKKLKGVIDDTSSFCQGELVNSILNGILPTCLLEQVNEADLILYWGSNPLHSHPRHLSKFSYYAHRHYQEGGIRRVTLATVEVRDSEISGVSNAFFKILPGEDKDFITAVTEGVKGNPVREDVKKFLSLLKRARFCIIFAGLGLTYSLENDFSSLKEMINQLSKWLSIAVIPMVGHFNMRGFNYSLYKATGYVNKVSFANGISNGSEFSFLYQLKKKLPDCILIIGANPFSSLPEEVVNYLSNIPVITMDPFNTETTGISQVVLGTAVSGLEAGGSAMRMDGTKVQLRPVKSSIQMSDEQILKELLKRV